MKKCRFGFWSNGASTGIFSGCQWSCSYSFPLRGQATDYIAMVFLEYLNSEKIQFVSFPRRGEKKKDFANTQFCLLHPLGIENPVVFSVSCVIPLPNSN